MSGTVDNPLHQRVPEQPVDPKLLEVETEVSHPKVSLSSARRPATHFSTRLLCVPVVAVSRQ